MAKVVWLGEDTEEIPGPSYHIWNGVKFPKDKPVEVTDPHMLAKARNNRFYKVTEDEADVTPSKQEVLRPQEGEQYAATDDMVDVNRVLRKQLEKHDAQTKAQGLADKAQELKAKVEGKQAQREAKSGYSPARKKPKKEKTAGDPRTAPDT